jgi:hypothetical protein
LTVLVGGREKGGGQLVKVKAIGKLAKRSGAASSRVMGGHGGSWVRIDKPWVRI